MAPSRNDQARKYRRNLDYGRSQGVLVTLRSRFTAAAAVLATVAVAAPTLAQTSPIRHLVYSFTYGSQQTINSRDQDMGAAPQAAAGLNGGMTSGISHYQGSLGDKGTMTVDVTGEQADKGLVVSISEQGENNRNAPPATCVVYGNTSVICDPNKTVNPEEYTLLRFLGSNFVDPNQLDAKEHWTVSQQAAGLDVRGDYTILTNANGVMTISELRKITQGAPRSTTTNVQTKIGYDFNRLVPTAVDEYVTQRNDAGAGGTATTIYQTTLQLVSDSTAKT
jgi:hypothetical protein